MGSIDQEYKTIVNCRACNNPSIYTVWNIGKQMVVNYESLIDKVPLELVKCRGCDTVQLKHTVNPDRLFRKYYYKSGTNDTMCEELQDIVIQAKHYVDIKKGDAVADIGANDGTLLSYFPTYIDRYGWEPSQLYVEAKKHGYIINDYFPLGYQAITYSRKFKIITAIAMFYDVEDPNEFLQNIKNLLHPDGLFVIQMNYLESMLKNNAFDNILHEHLFYYNLTTLGALLYKLNLIIFHVELSDINGGSFRVFIKHNDNDDPKMQVDDTVVRMMMDEQNGESIEDFATRILDLKYENIQFLQQAKKDHKTVYGYGAGTRGTMILQYFGIGPDLMSAIADRNPVKWGMSTTTGIPIISELQMRVDHPDYLYVLPWFFRGEFLQRENEYLWNGGSIVFPLPKFEVLQGVVKYNKFQVGGDY